MGWFFAAIAGAFAVWYYRDYKGAMVMYEREKNLNKLMRGENYYRLVSLNHNGREYKARVRRWNVFEAGPEIAELWSIEGSNPDGWTESFLWEHKNLQFID